MDDGKVHFRWKDYRDGSRQKTMSLQGGEFIRRFLIHVLPHHAKPGAVGLGSARRLAEYLGGSGLPQLGDLCRHALAVRRYPCIAIFHGSVMHLIAAPEKPHDFKAPVFVHNS